MGSCQLPITENVDRGCTIRLPNDDRPFELVRFSQHEETLHEQEYWEED